MSSRDTRPMLAWPWHLSAVSPARHRDIFCLFFAVLLGASIAGFTKVADAVIALGVI